MSWLDSNFIYKSGDKPKYKVGDKAYRVRIIMPKFLKTKIQKFSIEYEIISVSDKKHELFFKEFTYTIRALDNGEIIENVYESELCDKWVDFHSPKDPNINWEEEILMGAHKAVKDACGKDDIKLARAEGAYDAICRLAEQLKIENPCKK